MSGHVYKFRAERMEKDAEMRWNYELHSKIGKKHENSRKLSQQERVYRDDIRQPGFVGGLVLQ